MALTVKKGVLEYVSNDSERLQNCEGPYELLKKGLVDYIYATSKEAGHKRWTWSVIWMASTCAKRSCYKNHRESSSAWSLTLI